MPFHHTTLPNGLTLIGEDNPAALSTAVGFFVRTGARDEQPDVSGVSHFLEHMVFKGTPRRTALEVNKDFDRIGAQYNAYTSEENTVFWAAILPEYLPQAVDILADVLRPSLREDDFDMEKKVIIEEIGMYDDQPMWSAYDQSKRAFFSDHPLGNSILGTKESIAALKQEQMLAYFRKRYVAPNILVSVAGNFDWPKVVAEVEARTAKWEQGPIGRENLRETPGSGSFNVVCKDKTVQEHVLLLAAGPPAHSPLRYSAELMSMAIGDDTGSRLYWELVDPGHADSADTSFHEYDGAGTFITSFSGDPGRTADNLAIIRKILGEVQKSGITDAELHQAKSKVLSRIVRGNERPMGRMQVIGMTWTYLKEYHTVDDELKAFEAVSQQSIRELLEKYPITRSTTFALGPLKELKN